MNATSYPDAEGAATACATYIADLLLEALAVRPIATLAVSGGSTPRLMFEKLVKRSLDWNNIHVFWVDERHVPPSDPQSNFKLANQTLLRPAGVPESNVHRIRTEFEPQEAAASYETEMADFLPFDIVQRGMGADAHTASLFPGEPLIADRERHAGAVYVEKMDQWRITLLPRALLSARHTAVLVSGADKAEAVRKVFHEHYAPMRYPAQLGLEMSTWFLGDGAAALLKL